MSYEFEEQDNLREATRRRYASTRADLPGDLVADIAAAELPYAEARKVTADGIAEALRVGGTKVVEVTHDNCGPLDGTSSSITLVLSSEDEGGVVLPVTVNVYCDERIVANYLAAKANKSATDRVQKAIRS